MPDRIGRDQHALRHGPTEGDLVRLGDTDLWIRIERDLSSIRRTDLVANTAVPPIEVSPVDGTVRLDGRVLRAEPVREVPLSRLYLLG
jgi:urease alpha subunit